MDINSQSSILEKTIRIRNGFVIVSAISILSNLILSYAIYSQEKFVVVTPAFISQEYTISKKHVSTGYLQDTARVTAVTMLSMTPNNTKFIEETILRHVDPEFFGELKQQLYALAGDIKKRQVSTVFIPVEVNVVHEAEFTAEVIGDLLTFVGKQQTGFERKTYRMSFNYAGAGLLLKEFYEVKNDKNNSAN
jgi:type IV conjugative transfer system protein TraE